MRLSKEPGLREGCPIKDNRLMRITAGLSPAAIRRTPTGGLVLLFTVAAITACVQPLLLVKDVPDIAHVDAITLPDPSAIGPYTVRTLYYGSGTDKRRTEFRDSVQLKTAPVDASSMLPQFAEQKKWARKREKYWGFGPSRLPINARVWYPDGQGPFPLVLIVHGNHDMKKFSDPGYAYLGELLASRGYIVASVDENFLNGDIGKENDARGWLLLKHLEAFRGWNAASGNPFSGRVDLENIALIGHSRGGESVAHAASFNRLSHYPDDANVRFDFGFGIKSLIAIAPSDGQYQPADRLEPLSNINYFVLHGAHDGDVSSFVGMRQFQRLRFTDEQPWFKSALFIYRANHGQFNTTWGANDAGGGLDRFLLDKRAFLSGEEQRRIAKVYMSALLDATLREKRGYVALFRDYRVASSWLPKTIYENRFESNRFRVIADFEEDIDVTTGSAPGVRLAADSLKTWKEGVLLFRWTSVRHNNNVVTLGWNNRVEGRDTASATPGRYQILLGDSLVRTWSVGSSSSLMFGLASTGEKPGPRKAVADSAVKTKSRKVARKQKKVSTDSLSALDLTVELESSNGVIARLPLSHFAPIRPPLKVNLAKWKRVDRKMVQKSFEVVLQTFSLSLAQFAASQPEFDPARLRAIRFVFDRSVAGEVVLDQVGIQP